MMNTITRYENRVVAFIDLLGFKEIIKKTVDDNGRDNEPEIEALTETFRQMKDTLHNREIFEKMNRELNIENNTSSRQISQFSDSIVISFKKNEESEVFHTLYIIHLFITELALRGILCRGGISYGKLIHTDNMLFGPSLITAYETESKAALFPRVILDDTIIEIAKKYHGSHHSPEDELESILSMITKDTDNMYYIDYFGKAFENFNDPYLDTPDYIECLRAIISPYVNIDTPDLKVKYGWMINKFNKMISDKKKEVESDGYFIEDADIYDYYKNMDFIE